ncbi:uncharacterized protein B4U79_15712 [Dinothrombium tinctorium]|uniref:CUB domain-containing protein n=1 Tax=Dinothrombium tinctorium TaxID=1965070 RepID=A0A443RIP4_9ACAR|nr:uncharacterized protein B4U79_15712 [Dinothrombium tinctorium]
MLWFPAAPPGKRIKLEFRDHFILEESSNNCEYDVLEIRDGRYGYDKVLARLCGQNFPHEYYSSDRYMWLSFKSDESIEYTGFRAVYKWEPQLGELM